MIAVFINNSYIPKKLIYKIHNYNYRNIYSSVYDNIDQYPYFCPGLCINSFKYCHTDIDYVLYSIPTSCSLLKEKNDFVDFKGFLKYKLYS